MIASSKSTLIDRWRQRIQRRRRAQQPRPLAALGYLTIGSVVDDLIEIEKLVLVVQHDEILPDGRCALRLAGFSGASVPWGVQWGGPDQSRLYKDLRLQPMPGARGLRADTANAGLLELGLRLERDLQRYARNGIEPTWRAFRLPSLWAGFLPSVAATITGSGPELELVARGRGVTPDDLFRSTGRTYFHLSLYPLNWVSHEWQRFTAVFAALNDFPKRQIIACGELSAALIGQYGAAAFDFYNGRFREHFAACSARLASRFEPQAREAGGLKPSTAASDEQS
jgi:hypothetical protein